MVLTGNIARILALGSVFLLSASFNSDDKMRSWGQTDGMTERDLKLKLITTFPSPLTERGVEVILYSGSGEIYLIDWPLGKLMRTNWKTGVKGTWMTPDRSGCSDRHGRLSRVIPMATAPYVVVFQCERIELLDKTTLLRVRTVYDDNELVPLAFNLSPDEHRMAVLVKKGRYEFTRQYETQDWGMIREWKFGSVYFTLDNNLLARIVFRKKGPTSIGDDECGLQFYNVGSGDLASEWVLSTGDPRHVCPSFPLYSISGQADRMITVDYSHTAVAEWDTRNGKLIQHLKSKVEKIGPPPGRASSSLSYDGRLFAIVWWRAERVREFGASIWDLPNGRAVYDIPVQQQKDPILAVSFSSDGNHVAFVHQGRVEVCEYEQAD